METQWPESPRKLLEARYQAFVDGKVDFILDSHHLDTRSQVDRTSIEAWSKKSSWLGLKIEDERIEGEKAFLTFTVRYTKGVETMNHREHAEFRKDGGKWFYYDSQFPAQQTLKSEKIGRNDPCTCGSGKKFKKCCGPNS